MSYIIITLIGFAFYGLKFCTIVCHIRSIYNSYLIVLKYIKYKFIILLLNMFTVTCRKNIILTLYNYI